VADRDNTVSVGSAGNERQIANVAAGTARTDAANWGQVQDAVREVQHWVRDRFRQASRLANAGTAAALAATNVPQAYAPDQSALGAGIGSFKGQSALAVGLSTITPGGRWVVKGSLSGNTQGDVGVGMGAAMVW
jgi:autotransporter adhesin